MHPDPRAPAAEREDKKRREALRLRGVPPERTLQAGFELMRFTRHLAEAGARARR